MRKIWNNEKLYEAKFAFDERCKNAFYIVKEYFKTKKKNPIMFVGGGVLLLVLILTISFSFASLTPVSSIEIYSSNANFENGDAGAWKITKSAEWISSKEAEIKFKLESILSSNVTSMDLVLVLDNSSSMTDEKMSALKEGAINLVDTLISLDSTNKVALVSFDPISSVLSDFSSDATSLVENINGLSLTDNTDYIYAFRGVGNVLEDYQYDESKNFLILFITDGYSTSGANNDNVMYNYLKAQYPYMVINSIFYEMGDASGENVLNDISNNVFNATKENVEQVISKAATISSSYSNFEISDYINTDYFDIISADNITTTIGTASVIEDASGKKVVWNMYEEYYSGFTEEMSIVLQLKDEYINTSGIYQTNTKEVISSSIDGVVESVTSTESPVISNSYTVTYDGNAPDDCSVNNVPAAENNIVYKSVEINDSKPTCSGYKFKGWKINTEDVVQKGDGYFIMPAKDVTLVAEWSKVSVQKSMTGKITEILTLNKVMEKSAVMDNQASEYVSASTGIDFNVVSSDTNGKGVYLMASTANDEYPVYYYRGDVSNNNVKFADFCWKIVRTTSTGGVKLIYNGVPDIDGSCNISGDPYIGKSVFNSNKDSLADVGYMYGTRHVYTKNTSMSSTKFVYGNDVEYSNGVYTLKDIYTSTNGWSSERTTLATKYHYTCLTTGSSCSTVYYVYYFGISSYTYYFTLTGGKNIEDLKKEMFTNTNDSSIKTVIDNWYKTNMTQYTEKLEDTVWCNDRTFYSGALKGKDVDASTYYPNFGTHGRIYYETPSVVCSDDNDSFTVSEDNGNGALTYPVGLLTADEMVLAGNSSMDSNSSTYLGLQFWTMSPSSIYMNGVEGYYFSSNYTNYYVTSSVSVRPSISLKFGRVVVSGDGSVDNPYIVE